MESNTENNPDLIPKTIGKNGNKLNRGGTFKGAGRPKKIDWEKHFVDLLNAKIPDKVKAEVQLVSPGAKKNIEWLVVSTFNRALKGNPNALDKVFYYAGGKYKEEINHKGDFNIHFGVEEKDL
jgi:hypothetical protein